MNIEEQVCTLEQAKRLNELGIDSWSYFAWFIVKGKPVLNWHGAYGVGACDSAVWAFTVAELGVMLPISDDINITYLIKSIPNNKWHVSLLISETKRISFNLYNTEAEARAAMLIYLLKNNLITAAKINSRLNPNQ